MKIIDVQIGIDFYNENNPKNPIKSQSVLSKKVGCNKQMFTEWKKKCPKTVINLMKVQEITGCPIDKMIVDKK